MTLVSQSAYRNPSGDIMYSLAADIYQLLLRVYRRLFFALHGQSKNIRSTQASTHADYHPTARVGSGTIITNDVTMGMYTYVNRDSTIEKCSIGNYCSISSGVRINPFEHNLENPSTSPILGGSDTDLRSTVHIKNDVLISANVIILSGVTISTGSVIAAGAVVTKDTKPYEIVGGVPAHHIGWRFSQETRESLVSSQFWTQDPTHARKVLSSIIRPVSKQ